MSVVETLSGLVRERQRSERRQPRIDAHAVQARVAERLGISLLQRPLGERRVGDAEAMREKIFDCDRTVRWHGLGRACRVAKHLGVAKLGYPLRNRVVERKFALLISISAATDVIGLDIEAIRKSVFGRISALVSISLNRSRQLE